RQTDANRIVAGEINAMFGFNRAAIDTPDFLFAEVIERLDGLGRNLRGERPSGDPLGGPQVSVHQDWRDGEHVADVVEAVAGIVRGEVLFRAERNAQEITNGVAVFAAIEPVRRDPARI